MTHPKARRASRRVPPVTTGNPAGGMMTAPDMRRAGQVREHLNSRP